MIAKIELAVLDRLKSKGLAAREFRLGDGKTFHGTPSVYCYVENCKFEKHGQSYLAVPNIYLTVLLKNLRAQPTLAEKEKHDFMSAFITAVLAALAGQTLGIVDGNGKPDIKPLRPLSWSNITTEADLRNGEIVSQFIFETGFYVDVVDDEMSTDLTKIAMSYFLKPGDDTADATDEI